MDTKGQISIEFIMIVAVIPLMCYLQPHLPVTLVSYPGHGCGTKWGYTGR
ncbi:MAG: hypothetical protein LUQ70_06375 [Methanobacteriaceae archaeon]|nr:hypothetical protein [Methanobacteriaceae archaeon]